MQDFKGSVAVITGGASGLGLALAKAAQARGCKLVIADIREDALAAAATVLGAVGAGDIGTHFPPSDPQWRGARSSRFLEHAVSLARDAGYKIGNVDLTLICEAPKIGPHRPAMRAEVARMMGLDESAVSIKATTTERLGFTGRGEGIAAQAIVLVSHIPEGPIA